LRKRLGVQDQAAQDGKTAQGIESKNTPALRDRPAGSGGPVVATDSDIAFTAVSGDVTSSPAGCDAGIFTREIL